MVTNAVKRKALQSLPDAFFRFTPDPRVSDSTLVIHLRAGDALSGAVGNEFWQPPLAFYRQVILGGGYEDIVIVTEANNANPCAAALMERFSGQVQQIRVQTGSLEEDINTILSARTLVASNSSFPFSLALASRYIKCWHRFLPSCEPWSFADVPDVEQVDWAATDYPGNVQWSDVDAACQVMLGYPESGITMVSGEPKSQGIAMESSGDRSLSNSSLSVDLGESSNQPKTIF